MLIFSSEDTITGTNLSYESFSITQNMKIDALGSVKFDFSYAMNHLKGANRFAVYVWNKNFETLQGEIKLEVYDIVHE